MCHCVNVEIQSYTNQTVLHYPDWFKSSLKIRCAGIDNCLLEEIKDLWETGIQTSESCCGHNKAPGYISVLNEYIPKMLELGYEHCDPHPVFRNTSGYDERGFRADLFKPKSVQNLT